jgi:lysophospholipase L1-like esterase
MRRKRHTRGRSYALKATIIFLSVAPLTFLGVVNSSAAGADSTSPAFYLDLGGSASIGVQPTLVSPGGQASADGYANELVSFEATRGVVLQLTQLGCPGETTASMVSGGDHCYMSGETQLGEAMSYLMTHYSQAGLVTIDLGFNDLRPCLEHPTLARSCVKHQLSQVQQLMPMIIEGLRSAAGPNVSFVGLAHYDPFLADALLGSAGKLISANSSHEVGRLNATLQSAYASAGIPMAMVGNAFESRDVALVNVVGVGRVPENVANTCALTWMCQPAPLGPNIHPNDAGYAAIASSIEGLLSAPWLS